MRSHAALAVLALVVAACDPPVRPLRADELWVTLPPELVQSPNVAASARDLSDPGLGAIAGTDGRCSARIDRYDLVPCEPGTACAAESCTVRADRLRETFERELGVGTPGSPWRTDVSLEGRMVYISHVDGDDERVLRIVRYAELGEHGVGCEVPIEVTFIEFQCRQRNKLRMHACGALAKTGLHYTPEFCGR